MWAGSGGKAAGMRIEGVQGASDTQPSAVEDVGVLHRGADAGVAEEFLDRSDVVSVFQEMGGKRVAEGVAGRSFGDPGSGYGSLHGPLNS